MWVIDNQQYLGQLDGWNRAAQFADGLFETMVLKSGMILGLRHHVMRMSQGLSRLNIALPDENLAEFFESYARSFVDLSGVKNGVLKVVVSRGDSQRGYGYDKSIKPHVTAFYNSAPEYSNEIYSSGVDVTILNTQCSIQPQLAGLKHLNRLENVLAKAELGDLAFEGLMVNHLKFIIEGAMSNVFFEKNSELITPKLDVSGVAGVMRQCVMNYAVKNGIKITEVNITTDDLSAISKGFICNSVMGIVPIKTLLKREFKIGEVSTDLIDAWEIGDIYA
ncbi:aminodeoxychorismate lyase [Oceaniserpentilla sp. 4NH20-0058]|uniref:aminodeoxychorismate lyase n=1 Tax=Oceaniserpentilla sp. 4NH20-0058 TaxID=3127660 RepID=UPI0031026B61